MVWYEQWGNAPRDNLMPTSQLGVCAISAKPTYRSNFDIELCLQNLSPDYRVVRAQLQLSAEQCQQTNCNSLDQISKTLTWNIAPKSEQRKVLNLPMPQAAKLTAAPESLRFSATIDKVWVSRKGRIE